jgi:membrane protein DedA with SNARE-associated domain
MGYMPFPYFVIYDFFGFWNRWIVLDAIGQEIIKILAGTDKK